MSLFQYNELKRNLSKTFTEAKKDIENPTLEQNPKLQTVRDFQRCNMLSFTKPDGQTIDCPYTDSINRGEKRLDWLKEQIALNLPADEKLQSMLTYIEETAHQNGFLHAGQNGVNQVMLEKGISKYIDSDDMSPVENKYVANACFGVNSDGSISYTETCKMPRSYVQMNLQDGTRQFLKSDYSPATIIAQSTISADNAGKIGHTLNHVDIKIHDKMALAIFKDSGQVVDNQNLIDDIESKVHASDNRGILKKISDYISEKLSALTSPSLGSKSPRP